MIDFMPFQEQGIDFITKNKRVILADDMGLGKTLETLESINRLDDSALPAMIVSIKPGLYVWKNELMKWYGIESAIYSGEPEERTIAFEQFMDKGLKYIILNYAFVKELCDLVDRKFFKTLVCDEFHNMGLLNHKSKTFKNVKDVALNVDNLILVDGTPMRSTPADLFAPLHLLDPQTFTGYWKFVGKYCIVIDTQYGKEIQRLPKNKKQIREMLSDKLIRRLKTQVLTELPPKIRQPIVVEMTKPQSMLYDNLVNDMMFEYENNVVAVQNHMIQILRLRQLLVTPKLLGCDIVGGALESLCELVQNELDAGNPVCIFTPFRQAIPYIKEELVRKVTPEPTLYEIHGQQTSSEMNDNELGFQNPKNKNKVIIGTIKSGVAKTFTEAKVVYFLGYEWGAHENAQAEDRAHRKGQLDSVRCLYLLHKNTVDERVIDTLNQKQYAMDWVINPEEILNDIKENKK